MAVAFIRRNRRVFIAALILLAMFAFVISDSLNLFINQSQRAVSRLNDPVPSPSGEPISAFGDPITLSEIQEMAGQRQLANQFMSRVLQPVQFEAQSRVQRANDQAWTDIERETGIQFDRNRLNRMGPQFDVQYYFSQMANVEKQQARFDELLNAFNYYDLVSRFQTAFFGEDPQLPFGELDSRSMLEAIVLERKAEQLGMEATIKLGQTWVVEVTGGIADANVISQAYEPFRTRISSDQLFLFIANQVRIQQVRSLIGGDVVTPLDVVDPYRDLADRIGLSFVEVPVDEFLTSESDPIPDPTDAQVEAFFAGETAGDPPVPYREQIPDPERPSPGFRVPRLARALYVALDAPAIKAEETTKRVTGEAIVERYRSRADRFLPIDLFAGDPEAELTPLIVPGPDRERIADELKGEYADRIEDEVALRIEQELLDVRDVLNDFLRARDDAFDSYMDELAETDEAEYDRVYDQLDEAPLPLATYRGYGLDRALGLDPERSATPQIEAWLSEQLSGAVEGSEFLLFSRTARVDEPSAEQLVQEIPPPIIEPTGLDAERLDRAIFRSRVGSSWEGNQNASMPTVLFEPETLYEPQDLVDARGVRYVMVKVLDSEPSTPSSMAMELDGMIVAGWDLQGAETLRDVVAAAWKRDQARQRAREQAEAIAERARDLATTLKDVQDSSASSVLVVPANEFDRVVRRSLPVSRLRELDPFSDPPRQPNTIAEMPMAGPRLFEAYFAREPGIAVAPNQPETVYYVLERPEPEPFGLARMFGPNEASSPMSAAPPNVSSVLQNLQTLRRSEARESWLEELLREAGVPELPEDWNPREIMDREPEDLASI